MASPTELTELPQASHDLIDLLDRIYPPRCIQPYQTEAEARFYAGHRALIDALVELKREDLGGPDGRPA